MVVRRAFPQIYEIEHSPNVTGWEMDKLSGRKPIDFVCATNPMVIIDGPQSVDNTEKAQEAKYLYDFLTNWHPFFIRFPIISP